MAAELHQARVRDLLADAEEHAAAGRWDAVRALVAAALALDPSHAGAHELHARADATAPSDGERRQLTVMFCDVVGSTALSHHRDPELVREVLRSYQATCDEVVRRYGARIARYVGDGVLVYFGHPQVHEDDARRAVQAGLDLLQALEPVTDEVRRRYDVDLRIRVAVHTGVVVRADMGSAVTPDRDAIVGETPNVAARLQDHATPGSLLISEDTYQLVRGWFLVVPVGALELRGLDRPVSAYEVVEAAPIETRVEAQADLSPFVGRRDLLEELEQRWSEVLAGEGRSVVLSGPPGVGKTRLADVQRRRVGASDGTALLTSCSTLHGTTALHPLQRLVERFAGIEAHHEARHALTRLWAALDALGLATDLPLLADLLGIPPEPWCPAPELEGAKLHEEVLGTLVRWVRALAARSPLLIVVDDLQWADPSTVELVGRLVTSKVPGLLLLITARDDHAIGWTIPQVLALERLSADELGELARRLPEGRALSGDQLERAVERSDGIPLFLEELVRSSVLAHGEGDARDSRIPAGLRDLLLARFAAPGVDLRLAQLVATMGSEAERPVLGQVSDLGDADLDAQLGALVDVGILTVSGTVPATYRFRHQLLADLAYDTQLLPARRRAHGLVADALLAGHGVGPAAGPAVLAHHLENAERFPEAVTALTEAAEAAQAIGASTEAGELLQHAFDLLDRVEAGLRVELEFEARLLRGAMAASTMGYAAPQAITDFQACLELVASLDTDGYLDEERSGLRSSQERTWAGAGLWATFLLQGRIDDADEVLRNVLPQLRSDGPGHRYFSAVTGFNEFFRGGYDTAEAQLREVIAALDGLEVPARLASPGDPEVTALAHLAFVLTIRCRFDEAAAVSDRALELARAMPFPRGPFSVCYAAGMRAATELLLGDLDGSTALAEEQTEVAARHGFTFWSVVSGFYAATAAGYLGEDGAHERAAMSIALLRSLGVEVWLPSFLASLGTVIILRGEPGEAEGYLIEAGEVADRIGARFWSAEISRQLGVVRLARGDRSGLELVRDAVTIAVEQGARLHELWARSTLCEHSEDPEDHAGLARLSAELAAVADPAQLDAARFVLRQGS